MTKRSFITEEVFGFRTSEVRVHGGGSEVAGGWLEPELRDLQPKAGGKLEMARVF